MLCSIDSRAFTRSICGRSRLDWRRPDAGPRPRPCLSLEEIGQQFGVPLSESCQSGKNFSGDCILPFGRKGTADFPIRSRASGLIQQLLTHRIVQLLVMSACEHPAVEPVHWAKQG